MIDQPVGGACPSAFFSRRGCAPHGASGEGTSSPRVTSYQMDFTPEANKRMNPKPIVLEEVKRPLLNPSRLLYLSPAPNRDCFR